MPILNLFNIGKTLQFLLNIGNRLIETCKQDGNKLNYREILICGRYLLEWVENKPSIKNFLEMRKKVANNFLCSNRYLSRDHTSHYNKIFTLQPYLKLNKKSGLN